MRVLQINTVCKSGSTGKIAYELHRSLIKEGHESVICYGRGPVIDEPGLYKFTSNFGWKVHAFITRVSGITGTASNWSTNKLIKFIKEYKPDVVHIHNLHGYYVNIYRVMRYLKKSNINTIWTFHDDFMFTGLCGGYYLCNQWKNGCGECNKLKEYPATKFFDFTKVQLRWKQKIFTNWNNLIIVTPSNWLASRVRETFLKNKDIRVINNGIDTRNIFYPRQYQNLLNKHNLANKKVVLSVVPNFFDEKKGGKYILEIAKKMEKNLIDNIQFIIIGVNQKIRNLPSNVITVPRIENQNELAQYYSMADVFVLTSQAESFSMVCIEALACGTPIVGFDAGAPGEIVSVDLGKFVKYKDVDSLYNSIQDTVVNDKTKRCRENAVELYDFELMYNRYKYLYSINEVKK